MSENENDKGDAVAFSAEKAVASSKLNKNNNKTTNNRSTFYKGRRKGFSRSRNKPRREFKSSKEALDGHMFVDPAEDPTIQQDNYKLAVEAIEN